MAVYPGLGGAARTLFGAAAASGQGCGKGAAGELTAKVVYDGMARRPVTAAPADPPRWPVEFDPVAYRRHRMNRILRWMGPGLAAAHYRRLGRKQGRPASAVSNRSEFRALIARDARILEIGPFFSPFFDKADHQVAYVDVLTTEELKARAAGLDGGDPDTVPRIDHVWTGGRLSDLIDERFDVVFSSHNIEHQPCLISHLRDLAALLKPGGAVYLIVPDRRFCFDHFLPETTLLDILGGWFDPGFRHTARDVVKAMVFATHNEPARHWARDHGDDPFAALSDIAAGRRLVEAKARYQAMDGYVDVHAWQFSPEGFRHTVGRLHALGLSPLAPARIYPTLTGAAEFFAILEARQLAGSMT